MGRLHKAHAGQSRGHPIGAPPTLQTASGRVFSGFRMDQVGKLLSTGCSPSVLIFELFQRPFDVALQALPRR